jgi:hypothetical protein
LQTRFLIAYFAASETSRLSIPDWEAMMRVGAALVCIAVVYGFDALVFDGRYASGIFGMISDLYVHW